MMLPFIYLLAGVVLALVYLWTARRTRLIGEMTNYKIGLIVAALIYGHCKNKYPVSKAFAMAQAISLDTFYLEIASVHNMSS